MISGFVRAMLCLIVLGLPWGAGALAQGRDIQAGGFVTSLSDVKPNDGSFSIGLYIWFLDPAGSFDIERDISVNARSLSLSSIYTEPAPTGGTYTYARSRTGPTAATSATGPIATAPTTSWWCRSM